jgi:pyruvate kinase
MYDARMRRAKIIATLGPACADEAVLDRLVEAGVDVFRLNFSHGDSTWQREVFARARRAAQRASKHIPILADLQGPKIRFGTFEGGAVLLEKGQRFTISSGAPFVGDARRGHCPYPSLAREVPKGSRILANDGLLSFIVESTDGDDEVHTTVEVGGPLSDRKGLNFPGAQLRAPSMTDKDRRDLQLALTLGADLVAVSFVRTASDLDPVFAALVEHGSRAWVIAKIEKPQAVEHFAEILARADGIMLARGDLGVELAPERVPILQKEFIAAANRVGKPVITATQMLESMTVSPRPTRAEVSDVAGAIDDGTDAVMLSGETASGRYPVEAVQMMARIVLESERCLGTPFESRLDPAAVGDTGAAIAAAVVTAGRGVQLDAIALFTMSGYTARLVSHARPRTPILALARYDDAARRLNLLWGVQPVVIEFQHHFDEIISKAGEVVARSVVRRSGTFALLAGLPIEERRVTNLMALLPY